MDIERLLDNCRLSFHIKNYEHAIESCDEILGLDEKNPDALHLKASSIYHLKRYDEALKLIDDAIGFYPDCEKFFRIKSKIYFELKDFETALECSQNHEGLYDIASICLIMLDRADEIEYVEMNLLKTLKEFNMELAAVDFLKDYHSKNPDNLDVIDILKSISNEHDLKIPSRFYLSWIDKIISKHDTNYCPVCGESLIPVVYGYPTEETMLEAERGLVKLGGCVVDNDNSHYWCSNCDKEFDMGYYGLVIRTDDDVEYEYIIRQVSKVKDSLEYMSHSAHELMERFDHLDKREFRKFISRLLELDFIYRTGRGFHFNNIKYLKEGMYAAPRWLVYPELSAWTIGWRMGYGEDYALNEPPRPMEFYYMFPEPQNWLFNPRKCKYSPIPIIGYLWSDDGKPKYSRLDDDAVTVNDFITMDMGGEFRSDTFHFKSIAHALSLSKNQLFERFKDRPEAFKKGDDVIDREDVWNHFKYSVCLNAAYYKFMQNEYLKNELLATGDKVLRYESDDEWGGDENLFGFALMELRDEIRRLYKNENLVDWQYTEYLKVKDPYENPKPRSPNDKQSPEYRIISSTLSSAKKYVRDVNLAENLSDKYKIGQFIKERAFIDASNKIGGMITSHRYLILSNQMADLSIVDEAKPYGAHVGKPGSTFKVIDIYKIGEKTQIVLLHLPEGFEEVFANTTDIEKEIVSELREEFGETLEMEPVQKLTEKEWLERCEFPIGMKENGEFFKLDE